MTEREPAEAISPGEIIQLQLDALGWTQEDLAAVLDKSLSNVNQIMTGKIGVTYETAQGLADVFPGTTAKFWIDLETNYRLHSNAPAPQMRRTMRSQLYRKAPVREMIKREWIEPSQDPEVLEARVLRFLGIGALDDEPKPFRGIAARKATAYDETTPTQAAWLCRVKQIALAAPVSGAYEPARFPDLIQSLKPLISHEPEIRRVPRVLADFGVRFLIVEDLPGSRIDGVCVWFGAHQPVIVLSLRYGRVDSFWFTLFHELAHLKSGDGLKGTPTLDTELIEGKKELPPEEVAANSFAVETLVPQRELDNFIARTGPNYTPRNVSAFAIRIGVHPAIVIGQLAHPSRDEISWSRFGASLRPMRDQITTSALTDGWGRVVPSAD